uniref:Uncharacterized protein LOC114914209 n=1 Tax=Elaeis guineensis var. tenera TaxID=51953 RepID=A0A8N4EYT4_ELAGV|nr:uncharacterized protein LOC114914209 [Elaeis guineensis]
MIFSLTGRIKTREAIVGSFNETKQDGNGKKQEERSEEPQPMFSMKSLLWQAGSVWDAWFSCASNQTYASSTIFFFLFPLLSLSLTLFCFYRLSSDFFPLVVRLNRFNSNNFAIESLAHLFWRNKIGSAKIRIYMESDRLVLSSRMRAGGPSSADAAVLVLAAGDAVRRAAPAALRRAPNRKEKENVSFKNHVIQWFEVLDGLPGPCWKAFDCTFLHFGSVIQLIACARHTCSSSIFQSNPTSGISSKPQIKVIKSGPSLDSDKAPG